jgi:hypothetical protein
MRIRLALGLALAVSAMLVAGCGGEDESEAPAWVEDAQGRIEGAPEGAPEAFDYKGETVWVLEGDGGLGVVFAEDCDSPATLQANEEFDVATCFERGADGFQLIG